MSANTPALAKALAAAQAIMKDAEKDGTNPHFKSKYSTLSAVRAAVTPPLTANGIAVTQTFDLTAEHLVIVTTMMHESGERIESKLPLKPKDNTSQSLGAAISYGRRFALAAICGVASDEDDDGETDRRHPGPRGRGDAPERGRKEDDKPAGDKPAAKPEEKEAKHHERVQKIRSRLLEMTGSDAEAARKILSGILPGVESCQHLTPDQAWRIKIALVVMKLKDNNLEAAKTYVANDMKLPWVDKMTAEDRKLANSSLKSDDERPEMPSTDKPTKGEKDPF